MDQDNKKEVVEETTKQANNATDTVNKTVDDIKGGLNDLNQTADTTGEYDPQDIETNKVMAVLSYIGILFLVPLLAAKDSPFAKFHANQGIILFICLIGVNIINFILALVLRSVGGFLGWILLLAIAVLAVIGIYNAATGKAKELPIIGGVRIIK